MDKVENIINSLLRHEITKADAIERLTILGNISGNTDRQNGALNSSVSAIRFRDNSDYLSYHFDVVSKLTDIEMEKLTDEKIRSLYAELNPEPEE
jgi:hypothetical protein